MKKFLIFICSSNPNSSIGFDILNAIPRILAGYFLLVNFGGSKFPTPEWFIKDVATFGGIFAVFPAFFAWAAVLSETLGGLLLILGFGTRLAGFFLSCTMMVAIFFQKWNSELWEMLPALGFLWVAIYALSLGSGKIGLDYLISKKYFKFQ